MTATWRTDFASAAPFAHLSPWLGRLLGPDWPELAQLNACATDRNLRNTLGLPVQFAAQASSCGQYEYEAGIYTTGQVPSRECNWHDLFNALTWLAFPRTKAALNAVHQSGLRQSGNRDVPSDAATLFDESGLVLVGEDPGLANLLAARRWREAMLLRRAEWCRFKVYTVGHAVLEKLLIPWPGITAKCLYLEMRPDTSLDALDEVIAQRWRDYDLVRPVAMFPLPVLGIPGWWPEHEQTMLYSDQRYFRPPRILSGRVARP